MGRLRTHIKWLLQVLSSRSQLLETPDTWTTESPVTRSLRRSCSFLRLLYSTSSTCDLGWTHPSPDLLTSSNAIFTARQILRLTLELIRPLWSSLNHHTWPSHFHFHSHSFYFFVFSFPDSAFSPPILMSCPSHPEACNIRNHRWNYSTHSSNIFFVRVFSIFLLFRFLFFFSKKK